ncbi:MAG: glycosyltransferase family 2 protein [Kangiellaceae bacterium]
MESLVSVKLFISIVSHNDDTHIINNFNLLKINDLENVIVIIRDNVASARLEEYCSKNGIKYYTSKSMLGFGANNNRNFESSSQLGMTEKDWFLLFNPDIDITPDMILRLFKTINEMNSGIYAINLFSDKNFLNVESSLRKYPSIKSFINVLRGKSFTQPYNKNTLKNLAKVDWAAGSFLVFKASVFKQLNGFDEKYFMYFEDVDICYRANIFLGEKVVYLRDIHAVHKGGYKNRSVLSPHFRWYILSLYKFLKTMYKKAKL